MLPLACNRLEATWQKAVRVSLFDHEMIMEEAEKRDRLECVCVFPASGYNWVTVSA